MFNDAPMSFHLGLDGFYWWMGVVELVEDTLKLGRAKVRIIGWHEDESALSVFDLPWAYPVLPVSSATAVPNYKPGDWVIGFFLDGKLAQQPMILGVLPTIEQSKDD